MRISADELRRQLGSSLRAAAVWDHSALMNATFLTEWAGRLAADVSGVGHPVPIRLYDWIWFLKRWACQGLIAADPKGPYDVVITARPDLIVTGKWSLAFDDSTPSSRRRFSLTVGDQPPALFGDGEIVMSNLTNMFYCVNDWIAVSTYAASTTLEQFIHHASSAYMFQPINFDACEPSAYTRAHVKNAAGIPIAWPWASVAGENPLATYLYRAGLARQTYPLHIFHAVRVPPHVHDILRSGGTLNETWYPWQHSATMVHLWQDGIPYVHGLCGVPEFARFPQTPMAHSLTQASIKVTEYVLNPDCVQRRVAEKNAVRAAEKATPTSWSPTAGCWGQATPGGVSSKEVATIGPPFFKKNAPCRAGRLPFCKTHADLTVPLKPCIRRSSSDFVTNVSGYGVGFSWWHHCGGSRCGHVPNVTFDFGAGVMEQAVVYPHRGPARPKFMHE